MNGIDVNTLTSVPLVGDGLTSNLAAWQNIARSLQALVPSREWLSLYIPPGIYATSLPFGSAKNRASVDLFPAGISKVRVSAYGAVFDDLINLRPAGSASQFFSLNGMLQWYDFINSTNMPNSYSAGGFAGKLKNLANISKYSVGMWVCFLGLDTMSRLGKFTSGPPCNHFQEYSQVAAINAETGVIWFKSPTRFAYSDAFPNMWNGAPGTGPTAIGGGQAMIVPMNPAWDMGFEIAGARFAVNQPEGTGRSQAHIDCEWTGSWAPTVGRDLSYLRCKMSSPLNQIDKCMERLVLEDCEGIYPFYSTSVHTCVMKRVRGQIINTPRNLLVESSTLDQMKIGCLINGVTDSVVAINNRFNYFTYGGRLDGPGLGASNGGNAILANWTFSNGTLSRDLSTLPQEHTPQPWAVPGAKCFLSDEANVYNNMGYPFVILNVYMSGSVFKIDTTLQAIPSIQVSYTVTVENGVFTGLTLANGTPVLLQTIGTLPSPFVPNTTVYYWNSGNLSATPGGAPINSSGKGALTVVANPLHINVHPCARFTSLANTGTQGITDLNGAIDEPIFSRFKRGFVGRQVPNAAYQANYGRIWGNLKHMIVTVFQPATSGKVIITCPGFEQQNLGLSPFSQTIDLTRAGRRVVTPDGVTGFGGDILTKYGDWLSGGQSPLGSQGNNSFLSIVPTGNAVFGVEFRTDQGITAFSTLFGADSQSHPNSVNTLIDSSIQKYLPGTI